MVLGQSFWEALQRLGSSCRRAAGESYASLRAGLRNKLRLASQLSLR